MLDKNLTETRTDRFWVYLGDNDHPISLFTHIAIAAPAEEVESGNRSFMIYSKFGTALAIVSKTENASGQVSVQATADGTADIHEYNLADLKADGGLTEINAAVAKLPLKVFENKSGRRRKPL